MDQDTLGEVLGIEREISKKLDAEKEQARLWLESARHEIEQAKLSEIARLNAGAAQDDEAAAKAARDKAAGILQQATTGCERIRGLEDVALRPIIREHLAAIIPGNAK
jgi:hypothetical protein